MKRIPDVERIVIIEGCEVDNPNGVPEGQEHRYGVPAGTKVIYNAWLGTRNTTEDGKRIPGEYVAWGVNGIGPTLEEAINDLRRHIKKRNDVIRGAKKCDFDPELMDPEF